MMASTLPKPILARAESFFRHDLGGVRVRLGPEPRWVDAHAFARGQEIVLDPGVLRLPGRRRLEILGHELSHVVQQREGRARPTAALAGASVCCDPELEREADELGRRFARGEPWGRRPRRRRRCAPVIQRVVRVGGKSVEGPDSLAEPERLVLELTGDGMGWLEWAIDDQRQLFEFEDGPALVEGVHTGLHGESVMLLPGTRLRVAPRRLLHLAPEELRTLSDFEKSAARGGGAGKAARLPKSIQKILTDHDLVAFGKQRPDTVERFLGRLGRKSDPLFTALGLADWLALYRLSEAVSGDRVPREVQRGAADFAAGRATGVRVFVDLFEFFVSFRSKLSGEQSADPEQEASRLLSDLQPHAWEMLMCPRVEGELSTVQATTFVHHVLASDLAIGFHRSLLAAGQIVSGTDNWGERPIARQCSRYWADLQSFLARAQATGRRLSQDARTWEYEFEGDSSKARLILSEDGLLAVERFPLGGPRQSAQAGR